MSDQIIHVMYVNGRFVTLSKEGKVFFSRDGMEHGAATPAEIYWLLFSYSELMEAKIEKANNPWWRKLWEKLK